MSFLNYIRDLPRTIETIVPLPPCPAPLSELQFAKNLGYEMFDLNDRSKGRIAKAVFNTLAVYEKDRM